MQSILGEEHETRFVQPPMEMDDNEDFPAVGLDSNAPRGFGLNAGIRKGLRHAMGRQEDPGANTSTNSLPHSGHSLAGSQASSGVYEPESKDSILLCSGKYIGKAGFADKHSQSMSPQVSLSRTSSATKRSMEGTRGHARDPLEEEYPYLFIGPSTYTGTPPQTPHDRYIRSDPIPIPAEMRSTESNFGRNDLDEPMQIVSESPGAAEFDIYETAYRQELERINSNLTVPSSDGGDGTDAASAKVYLTRRVEGKQGLMDFVKDKALDLQSGTKQSLDSATTKGPSAFNAAVSMLRTQLDEKKGAGLERQTQEQEESAESR